MADPVESLNSLPPDLLLLVDQRDGAARLLQELPARFSPHQISEGGDPQRTWELAGLHYFNSQRWNEALGIFWRLYQHMLAAQTEGQRVHKGMPLCWISDCFSRLGCAVHAKRYLQLTLCEDAIACNGRIPPGSTGSYFRLVWGGMPDREFQRYAQCFSDLAKSEPDAAMFPEALLQ